MHPDIFVVTAAIILKGDKFVLTKRYSPDKLEQHEKWYFPGGKLEYGESLADCIRREIKEELETDFTILAQLDTYDWIYKSTGHQVILIPFLGTCSNNPIPNLIAGNSEVCYIRPYEIMYLELMRPEVKNIFSNAVNTAYKLGVL